ncbi:MAG: hypothetical protein ABIQ89_02315 [Candidatus Saccharimonadales bacterium]
MEEPRIYRDFDLPTKHLASKRHFVPAKARDEVEIERRRQRQPGVLIAEQQERGLAVAGSILKHLAKPDGVGFAARILPAAGLNTAWYQFARGAEYEVMRRRLKLPFLAVLPNYRQSSEDMRYDAACRFDAARAKGAELITAIEGQLPKTERTKRSLGRMVGTASLVLACAELGDRFIEQPLSSTDTQLLVRQNSLRALNDSRTLEAEIGLPPSIAQLSDPDSHLSVFWRREAPTDALNAYHSAVDLQLS